MTLATPIEFVVLWWARAEAVAPLTGSPASVTFTVSLNLVAESCFTETVAESIGRTRAWKIPVTSGCPVGTVGVMLTSRSRGPSRPSP